MRAAISRGSTRRRVAEAPSARGGVQPVQPGVRPLQQRGAYSHGCSRGGRAAAAGPRPPGGVKQVPDEDQVAGRFAIFRVPVDRPYVELAPREGVTQEAASTIAAWGRGAGTRRSSPPTRRRPPGRASLRHRRDSACQPGRPHPHGLGHAGSSLAGRPPDGHVERVVAQRVAGWSPNSVESCAAARGPGPGDRSRAAEDTWPSRDRPAGASRAAASCARGRCAAGPAVPASASDSERQHVLVEGVLLAERELVVVPAAGIGRAGQHVVDVVTLRLVTTRRRSSARTNRGRRPTRRWPHGRGG